MPPARILIISGSMGAGKTTVMGEASDLLSARNVIHAAFDLDALGVLLLGEPQSRALHHLNLSTLYRNCLDAGVESFLIAAAIESGEVLADLASAFSNASVTVCRLTASVETMETRLGTREVGFRRREYIARSRVLNTVLNAAGVEDFQIANEGLSVTAAAQEMLIRANWITS